MQRKLAKSNISTLIQQFVLEGLLTPDMYHRDHVIAVPDRVQFAILHALDKLGRGCLDGVQVRLCMGIRLRERGTQNGGD